MTNPWQNQRAIIKRRWEETPGVFSFELEIIDVDPKRNASSAQTRFLPGQFNMIYVPGVGEAAISISGPRKGNEIITHTIREVGNVTSLLARLREGESVGLRGPFGSSWPVEVGLENDLVLVAGGIGLAPLRPVLYAWLNQVEKKRRCILLMGARDYSGLLYADEYAAWERDGVEVYTTTDRPHANWHGNVGVVTTLFERLKFEDPARVVVMTCGPEVMMWYSAQAALSRRIPAESIYVSLERNMNCAIGLCGHCQFGPNFICKDGPVFGFDRVASILRISDL